MRANTKYIVYRNRGLFIIRTESGAHGRYWIWIKRADKCRWRSDMRGAMEYKWRKPKDLLKLLGNKKMKIVKMKYDEDEMWWKWNDMKTKYDESSIWWKNEIWWKQNAFDAKNVMKIK